MPLRPPTPRKKLTSYVGFANLPNQVHRAAVRKGFTFTAMVVGTCFFWKPCLSFFTLITISREVAMFYFGIFMHANSFV